MIFLLAISALLRLLMLLNVKITRAITDTLCDTEYNSVMAFTTIVEVKEASQDIEP